MGHKVSEAYASAGYLNAEDIGREQVVLQIVNVDVETMRDDTEKLACNLRAADGSEYEKIFLLNRTNAETLAEAYGDDTSGWAGKMIVLYTAKTLFQGKRVNALRVRVPIEGEVETAKAKLAAE